jgi:hypothetical protein
MVRVFLAALFALSPSPEPASAESPNLLDRRCYALMAQMAEEEDPQVRSAAIIGAQYFLGRMDSTRLGDDPEQAEQEAPSNDDLLRRCTGLLAAGGRDFRSLGETLVRRDLTL